MREDGGEGARLKINLSKRLHFRKSALYLYPMIHLHSHSYWKKGKPIEAPVVAGEDCMATLPLNMVTDHDRFIAFDWGNTEKRCGLRSFAFSVNGLEYKIWKCQKAFDADLESPSNRHGDVYMDMVCDAINSVGEKANVGWDYKWEGANTALSFTESVCTWGYGNGLANTISTPEFLRLTLIGRGRQNVAWKWHIEALLRMVGVYDFGDAWLAAEKVFTKRRNSGHKMGELLRIMAHVKGLGKIDAARHFHPYDHFHNPKPLQ